MAMCLISASTSEGGDRETTSDRSCGLGRVDLVYYDRSCDPAGDTLNCVTLSSTTDSGTNWSSVSLLAQGFDGDKYQACLAFVDPPNCGVFFLGDYIAVASTSSKAQALWTGNGAQAMDVFSGRATFAGG
jgi:hypothetical protein